MSAPKPGEVWYVGDSAYPMLRLTDPAWISVTGTVYKDSDINEKLLRRAVVIDPQSDDQVWQFTTALNGGYDLTAMREVFARFLNPRPDEPILRWAAVEDREGREWVRTDRGNWMHFADPGWYSRPWLEVDAVHVLSPGVPE